MANTNSVQEKEPSLKVILSNALNYLRTVATIEWEIETRQKRIENYRKEYSEKRNKGQPDFSIGGYVFFLFICIGVILLNIFGLIPYALREAEDIASIIIAIGFYSVFVIAAGIFGIFCIVAIIQNKLNKKYINKVNAKYEEKRSQYNKEEKEKVALEEAAIKILQGKLKEPSEEECCLYRLPLDYQNEQAIAFMLTAVNNGRVDTLREAIELYEIQLHRWRVEGYAQASAEYHQQLYEAQLAANEKLAETNEQLASLEKELNDIRNSNDR